MSTSKSDWKQNLLRTSVPLEHEAARVLSQQDYSVSAAYAYDRLDGLTPKEFSVDVRGVATFEPNGKINHYCVFDLFVECKYRQRGVSWLFLPEPKSRTAGLHTAIQAVDVMSTRFVHDQWFFDESESAAICYAAVEVGQNAPRDDDDGRSKNKASDSQLRHGLRQLQYAMPAILAARMRWVASQRPEENYPFFFVPVLVTNAPLIVADHEFSVSKVENARTLEELGKPAPYVIWSAGLGPEFYVHCQRQLRNLRVLAASKCMKLIEERRLAVGVPAWLQPSGLAELIEIDGSHADQIAEFKQIVVTDIDNLGKVAEILKGGFTRMAKSLHDKPIVRW